MQGFDLLKLIETGDAVSLSTAVILLFMSVLSWTVIVLRLLHLKKQKKDAEKAAGFWNGNRPEESSAWGELLREAEHASENYDRKAGNGATVSEKAAWIAAASDASIERAAGRFARGLPVLSSIGATAPFIGLFGTVWGIFHTLMTLSGGGQMTIDQVAGPIGEALVMTGFGLFVAIPAVLGNNAVSSGNRRMLAALASFASDVTAFLVTGQKPVQRKGE